MWWRRARSGWVFIADAVELRVGGVGVFVVLEDAVSVVECGIVDRWVVSDGVVCNRSQELDVQLVPRF